MTRIDVGYFEQFLGANTLLISVDDDGLEEIARLVERLAEHGGRSSFRELPGVHLHNVDVFAEICGSTEGIVPVGDQIWLLQLNRIERDQTVNLVRSLIGHPVGHQFVEPAPTSVQLIISKGEYPPEWWEANR